MTRKATKRLLEMVDDGVLSPSTALGACLNYMSEADVLDMCESEGFFDDESEE